MGIHLKGGSSSMRQTHAFLDRKTNGDIYAVLKLNFKADAKRFEYCFIGKEKVKLTFDGKEIAEHPVFLNIEKFEGWCNVYTAEHDIK